MATFRECIPEVTQFIRRLRGGSQPMLVQASDGLLYVIKFANNLQGSNLSFNECIGTELYRACALRTPSWKLLMLVDSFIDRCPECWIETEHGLLRPTAGPCFGSLFLGTGGTRLLEILPQTSYCRVINRTSFWLAWLLDICAEHADNRQALFVQDVDGRFEAHFVDQGHFFGGPKGNERVHYIASRYLDPRIYPTITSVQHRSFRKVLGTLDVDLLWGLARALPDEWKLPSALNGLERCLQRLSKPLLLQNLLDTIVDSGVRRIGIDHCIPRNGRKPTSVLCSGVQSGDAVCNSAPRRTGYSACGQG
jgi:hypothetical protein